MATSRIVFFNNKGGVGKTTLLYHLAYMLKLKQKNVLVADLDPQTNLTAMFLGTEKLNDIFINQSTPTITDALQPIFDGEGFKTNRVRPQIIEEDNSGAIHLIIGNLKLSTLEDDFSDAWAKNTDAKKDSFKKTASIETVLAYAETQIGDIDFTLIDVGPNLGALNRAIVLAADYIISPVSSDLFSLQGLENLGTTLSKWKKDWQTRCNNYAEKYNESIFQRKKQPIGYILSQHTAIGNTPAKAYFNWASQIPFFYKKFILNQNIEAELEKTPIETDENCLSVIKHYRSLMPLAQEANKPIFLLKPADGAIGSHYQAAQKVKTDFSLLADKIIAICEAL